MAVTILVPVRVRAAVIYKPQVGEDMDLFQNEHPFTTEGDISSWAFWGKSIADRDDTFSRLRSLAPVSWHRPMDESPAAFAGHTEKGFWAVTRAADINAVSQDHRVFSSELGTIALQPIDRSVMGDRNMILVDPPNHTKYRTLISSFFTPKGVALLQSKLEQRSKSIVENVVDVGEFDLVEKVSSQLPMQTVADLVGVPESLVPAFTKAGNDLIAVGSDQVPEGMTPMEFHMQAVMVLRDIALDLVSHRRQHPENDIATALAQGRIDGAELTETDIVGTIGLLASAGNDTTRHTTSWTVWNLWSNPDQLSWIQEDLEGRINVSVDEFIRHATVVNFFARTATEDTQLAGVDISAGDKVGLFYCSGNRDETLFRDPNRFDVCRPRENHVAFGGRGVHFCLGNVVAKAQLRTLFREILTRIPNLELRGEPETQHSEQFNAVVRLPVST